MLAVRWAAGRGAPGARLAPRRSHRCRAEAERRSEAGRLRQRSRSTHHTAPVEAQRHPRQTLLSCVRAPATGWRAGRGASDARDRSRRGLRGCDLRSCAGPGRTLAAARAVAATSGEAVSSAWGERSSASRANKVCEDGRCVSASVRVFHPPAPGNDARQRCTQPSARAAQARSAGGCVDAPRHPC